MLTVLVFGAVRAATANLVRDRLQGETHVIFSKISSRETNAPYFWRS